MAIIERPTTDVDDAPVIETDRPDGPVAAALVAGGAGCAAMGFFTVLAEASAGAKDWLVWSDDVGSLSGQTSMTVLVWLAAWAALHLAWRRRSVPFRPVLAVTLALIAVGAVATFPTVFQAFES